MGPEDQHKQPFDQAEYEKWLSREHIMSTIDTPERRLQAKHKVEQAVVDAYWAGWTRTEIEVTANKAIDDYERGLGKTFPATSQQPE